MAGSLADNLLRDCRQLLSELEAFDSFLRSAQERAPKSKFEHVVDMKQFNGMVSTEFKSLQKVSGNLGFGQDSRHLRTIDVMNSILEMTVKIYLSTKTKMCIFKRLFLTLRLHGIEL